MEGLPPGDGEPSELRDVRQDEPPHRLRLREQLVVGPARPSTFNDGHHAHAAGTQERHDLGRDVDVCEKARQR